MPSLLICCAASPAAALAIDVEIEARSSRSAIVERGEVPEGACSLEQHQQVRQLVLGGLEGADRHAELLALLGVVDGDVERLLRGADALQCEGHRRLLDHAAQRGRSPWTRLAQHAVGRDVDVIEGDGRQHPARIERVDGRDVERAAGDDERPDPVVSVGAGRPGDDHDLRRLRASRTACLTPDSE